jgi:hypothetical protein
MDNIISQFKAGNLVMRLTNEKLFIDTATLNESIALSSIQEINVVDLLEEHGQKSSIWNKEREGPLYVFGVLFAIWGLYSFSLFLGYAIFVLIISVIVFIWAYVRKTNNLMKSPKEMMALRISYQSGNREYKFENTGVENSKINDFITKVESRLSAVEQNKV